LLSLLEDGRGMTVGLKALIWLRNKVSKVEFIGLMELGKVRFGNRQWLL
jgi:hypothetical protein